MHCTVGDNIFVGVQLIDPIVQHILPVAWSNFSKVGMSCCSGVVLGVLVACQWYTTYQAAEGESAYVGVLSGLGSKWYIGSLNCTAA